MRIAITGTSPRHARQGGFDANSPSPGTSPRHARREGFDAKSLSPERRLDMLVRALDTVIAHHQEDRILARRDRSHCHLASEGSLEF